MPQRKQQGDRLNAVIATRDDGTPLRARDAILEWIETGFPWDTAILRASIAPQTMRGWMAEAARVRERATINPETKLTPQERDLVVFARQVDQAQAQGEHRYWELMQSLAKGNLQKTTTTIKVVADPSAPGGFREIERTVKSERTLPHERALQWILENRYGRRLPLDVRVAEVGALDDDERAQAIGDAMEHWLHIHNVDVPPELTSGNAHEGNGHA